MDMFARCLHMVADGKAPFHPAAWRELYRGGRAEKVHACSKKSIKMIVESVPVGSRYKQLKFAFITGDDIRGTSIFLQSSGIPEQDKNTWASDVIADDKGEFEL